MPRYRLLIEYDGSDFCGWQSQETGNGVQNHLQKALCAFIGEDISIRGAGRTDAGVHALGQVCHFDCSRALRTDTIRDAGNAHLRPHPIAIVAAEAVPDDFDARFSALRRHYRYRIVDRRAPPTLTRHLVWHVKVRLDVERMADAATALLGRHDFTTFRSSECQAKSPVKTLDRLDVVRVGEEIHLLVSARSFLHNQVRSMAGALRKVGDGSWSRNDLAAALEARERRACAPVAPASGLCLIQVDY